MLPAGSCMLYSNGCCASHQAKADEHSKLRGSPGWLATTTSPYFISTRSDIFKSRYLFSKENYLCKPWFRFCNSHNCAGRPSPHLQTTPPAVKLNFRDAHPWCSFCGLAYHTCGLTSMFLKEKHTQLFETVIFRRISMIRSLSYKPITPTLEKQADECSRQDLMT